MNVSVKHEAEHYRQHARYRIPAQIIYGNKVFKVAEWSVAGLSIEHFDANVPERSMFTAFMVFNFDAWRFSIKLEVEKLRTLDNGTVACRFHDLSTQQLSIFHQIINAYLSGEVIAVSDVLNVASREGMVKKDFTKRLQPERNWWQSALFHFKRVLGYTIFGSIIFFLATFVISTAYERIFVIESLTAKITTQQTLLRSPENGFFKSANEYSDKLVKKGDLLGLVKLVSGGASSIESPCDCVILTNYVEDGLFVGQGEPVFSLIDATTRLHIEAAIPFADVQKIQLGQYAEIRLTDGRVMVGYVQNVLAMDSGETSASGNFGNAEKPLVESARVLIKPDGYISHEQLNSVAYVSIYTLKEKKL